MKASLAGRFDKYDDITAVDDAKTWNAGLEWRPMESLLIRGSYATSFKAPDLHWVFSEGSGSFGNTQDPWRCIAAGANPTCAGYSYSMFSVSYTHLDVYKRQDRWSSRRRLSLSL